MNNQDQVDVQKMEAQKVKQVLEAAILAADAPLDRDAMQLLFDEADRPDKAVLSKLLEELGTDYNERGIELREVASGFRFQVRSDLGPWVSRLWQEKPPRYSRAILETLALVAYRQPITRGEIEEIRGVAVSTNITRTLLERGWVRVVGHRDVPGRPAMYATTRQFLDYFDLKSLEDLPPLSEIRDLDKLNEELEFDGQPEPAGQADGDGDANADQGEANAGPSASAEQGSEQASGGQEESSGVSGEYSLAADDDPEIDESTLMDIEQVDAVLADFEAQFRKKDKPGDQHELQAHASAAASTDEIADTSTDEVDSNPENAAADDDQPGDKIEDAVSDSEPTRHE